MTNKRNSGIELLRIVSMLMIVGWHIIKDMLGGGFKGADGFYQISSLNQIGMLILQAIVIIAVNCYVLITGYFSVTSAKLKPGKILDILLLTSFYGTSVYLISVAFGFNSFNLSDLVMYTLPYFSGKIWFVNIYVILSVLSPFINITLTRLSKKQYKILLAALLGFFSVWATFLPNPPNNDNGYGIITFVVIYTVGGYLRLHYTAKKPILHFGAYLLFTLITLVNMKFGRNGWDYNSIFNILSAVNLFLAFKQMNFSSKFVNYIASSTLAVYVLHTHGCIRPTLFTGVFKLQNYLTSNLYFVYYLLAIITIFAACIFIDKIRELLFKYTFSKLTVRLKDVDIKGE